MKGAKASPAAAPAQPQQPQKGPGAGTEVYKVAVGDAPTKGGKQRQGHHRRVLRLPVPVLQRASSPTLEQLVKDYGKDVRVVVRATTRCRSTTTRCPPPRPPMAAREQGKFWEMHDKLFANQQDARPPEPREVRRRSSASTWASSRPRSTRRRARSAIKARPWTTPPSSARAARPTFFINGRSFRGAQPFEAFKERHRRGDQEGRRQARGGHAARQALRRAHPRTPRPRTRPAAPPPPRRPSRTTRPVYTGRYIKGAPVKGAKDALVTIVEFSDFQCPFCSASSRPSTR